MTQEQLDTTRRDNAELKSRAADLQSQLDKLQKLIQLKNDQLASLQAEKGDPATAARRQLQSCPRNWQASRPRRRLPLR